MNNSVISGRVETPGHINSPGVQHSTTAEIAAQQAVQSLLHGYGLLSLNLSYLLVDGDNITCPL